MFAFLLHQRIIRRRWIWIRFKAGDFFQIIFARQVRFWLPRRARVIQTLPFAVIVPHHFYFGFRFLLLIIIIIVVVVVVFYPLLAFLCRKNPFNFQILLRKQIIQIHTRHASKFPFICVHLLTLAHSIQLALEHPVQISVRIITPFD